MLVLRSVLALCAAKAALAAICKTCLIAHEGDTIGEEVTHGNRASAAPSHLDMSCI